MMRKMTITKNNFVPQWNEVPKQTTLNSNRPKMASWKMKLGEKHLSNLIGGIESATQTDRTQST